MRVFTKEQVEAQNRKFPVPGFLPGQRCGENGIRPSPISSVSAGSTPAPATNLQDQWGEMNKTEREFLNTFLLSDPKWSRVEREAFTLRIGPAGERCSYTPDFSGMCASGAEGAFKRFCLVEVKGAFEREDARVKRMAAARWCREREIGFLFAQKTKSGWYQKWIA